jgi:hypothetical protein
MSDLVSVKSEATQGKNSFTAIKTLKIRFVFGRKGEMKGSPEKPGQTFVISELQSGVEV